MTPMKTLIRKLSLALAATLSFTLAGWLSPAFAAGGGIAWDKFPSNRVTDMAALQNGAKLFVNYCLNLSLIHISEPTRPY